jgi:DNA-binding transcriptional LysR family regulator
MHTGNAKHDATGMDRLAAIDLNLLIALHHLLDAGGVTAAARRMATTQSSMSRTLARLRVLFGDPLLVPRGRTLVPTARARELAPRIVGALAAMRHVFEPGSRFVPAQERFVLRVAASDYAIVSLLRPWLTRLRRDAPGITVRIDAVGIDSIDGLVRGDIDVAVAPYVRAEGTEQLVFRAIATEAYFCALRRGHAAATRPLTLARYLALDHVAISNRRNNFSDVQEALQRLGHDRKVAAVVPSFLAAANLVAGSDLAAVLPHSLLGGAGHDLIGKPVPFAVPGVTLHLVWHPRWTTDPRHIWLRGHIADNVPTELRPRPTRDSGPRSPVATAR